ncbi:CBM96 family carbohydrate-binding protein [Flavobacterium algicola]|uniref:CBM96 family carbohydrate-binding protein n=1 Tax=Flavobacterium algicola TaxID=556529 RepID=UPI001EFCA9AB|nr:DNRLRE domain-containing protein [Flavobacterium algicola]MCG9792830.1 DNRLRE domain-containing protein [Flavobacterium algicola]
MKKNSTLTRGISSIFTTKSSGLLVAMLAVACTAQAQFVHPGISHKKSDLERMKYMVEAQVEPYSTSYQNMVDDTKSSYNYVVQGDLSMTELGRDSGVNYGAWNSDIRAAYYNAVRWTITGDTRHADKAIEIFNAWSNLTSVTSGGTESLSGGVGYIMIEAAEIIKNTYSGWNASDVDRFKAMLVYPGYSTTVAPTGDATFYWKSYQGDAGRHGNQGLSGWRTVMAMGVFLDNEIMYDRALNYIKGLPHRSDDLPYPSGPNTSVAITASTDHADTYSISKGSSIEDYGFNELMTNYIYPNGQCQESSRDQDHVHFGLGLLGSMAEMAWNQGDDLYTHANDRLLTGLEFNLKYNVSAVATYPDQTTAWEPADFIQGFDRTGRWYSKSMSPDGRGNFTANRPNWELVTAHYIGRGFKTESEALWTKRARDKSIELSGYEKGGWSNDAIGWGGLTFRRPDGCFGDPINGFESNGLPAYAMNVLPGTVEAENFDYDSMKNGEGRVYHDLNATNTGGAYRMMDGVDIEAIVGGGNNLTSIESGEWLTYTVSVPETAVYSIKLRYAASQAGSTIKFSAGGEDVTTALDIPFGAPNSTGNTDWKEYTISTDVVLNKGVQSLKISFGGVSQAFKLDNFTLAKSGIVKQDQSIKFFTLPNKVVGAVDYDPSAKASSELSVSYTSSNTDVATIVDGKIHLVGVGQTTITANQIGDMNFNAAPAVSQELNVVAAITGSETLSAVADSYVHGGSTGSNYGTATSLVTKAAATSRYAYYKFDLSAIPGEIVSAKLRLYQRTSNAEIRNVYDVADDSWSESTLNWNNKPAYDNERASIITNKSTWNEWDVSSYVAQEYANDKLVTMVVNDPKSVSVYGIDFYSKEFGSYSPELVVEYSKTTLKVDSATIPVTIYPNPVQNELVIFLSSANLDPESTAITINTMSGQQVMQSTANSAEVRLNLSELSTGVYILTLQDKSNKITRKIMKL